MAELLSEPQSLATRAEQSAYLAMFTVWQAVFANVTSLDPFETNGAVGKNRGLSVRRALDINWAAYCDASELNEISTYIGKHAV